MLAIMMVVLYVYPNLINILKNISSKKDFNLELPHIMSLKIKSINNHFAITSRWTYRPVTLLFLTAVHFIHQLLHEVIIYVLWLTFVWCLKDWFRLWYRNKGNKLLWKGKIQGIIVEMVLESLWNGQKRCRRKDNNRKCFKKELNKSINLTTNNFRTTYKSNN